MSAVAKAADTLSRSVRWPDAVVELIEVLDDELSIFIRQSNGVQTRVVCDHVAGYTHVGCWDDITIESGDVTGTGAFLDQCFDSLRKRPGLDLPDRSAFMQLTVTFIDDSQLAVVMTGVRVEEPGR